MYLLTSILLILFSADKTFISKLSLSISFLFTLIFKLSKSTFLVIPACTSFANLSKSTGVVINFGISNLSTFVFNDLKFVFNAKVLVSTPVILSNSSLVV